MDRQSCGAVSEERTDLTAQDQILGGDDLARPEEKGREASQVGQQPQKRSRP